MSDLSAGKKEILERNLLTHRELLLRELTNEPLFKETKSPEVLALDESSFEEQIAEVDHELVNQRQAELHEIQMALTRIEDGSYGTCIDCGSNIGYERLNAYPMARRCVECKQIFEKNSA